MLITLAYWFAAVLITGLLLAPFLFCILALVLILWATLTPGDADIY